MEGNNRYSSGLSAGMEFPPKSRITGFTQDLAVFIFPVIEGGGCRNISAGKLKNLLVSLLTPMKNMLTGEPEKISDDFLASISGIKELLYRDAKYIFALISDGSLS